MALKNDIDEYFEERENDCVLYDRSCLFCGECDRCDLNADKICDNCGVCIEEKADTRQLDAVFGEEEICDDPFCQSDDGDYLEDDSEVSMPPSSCIDPDELAKAWETFRAESGWEDDESE